ncbi:PRC-barrel domain-containing protein [Paracoccus saliphilus]|uniref:PRC-barrel domain-containing protein n=1 Tax=Paracoccus saliphilus TaxID=405559 RepID=A0AA45W327_9RHOB|nr:PRC-barrel domain-containing protein [Paracoccus saliphilus]WCR04945.1 PRC-barrel domain-containing protein [Paracoccus saliphilus]SIS72209.1 PRC-barrel domain-containing protein [Paracoccus saliphilus]
MRKLFMTTAIVLPFALAPAFAQETTTEEPAMDPAAEAQTDPAADAAAAEAEAAAAAEEALKAEVAESGKVAQEQAANELRLDWVTDATVTAPDGTSIGSINDLILDGESGSMIAAVIGVGGFLGIGEKQIAVPWEQLTVNADAQEITSDLTKEEADVAPAYVFRERAEAPGAATDDAMAPADDAMAPADDAAAPADDAMAPADDAAAPADDAMAPADDAAPAEGEAMEGEEPASN